MDSIVSMDTIESMESIDSLLSTCAICQENNVNYIKLLCGHKICNTCLIKFKMKDIKKCPYCRNDIVNIDNLIANINITQYNHIVDIERVQNIPSTNTNNTNDDTRDNSSMYILVCCCSVIIFSLIFYMVFNYINKKMVII